MPFERRPSVPVPRGVPRGSRPQAHRVADNETFESVGRKYGIPVDRLIWHNFATLDAAEINWYLREYVGCTLPTHDRMNWRFSSSARPGLVYLPQTLTVLQMDPIEISGSVPTKVVALDRPGPSDILASNKFTYEFKIPPKSPKDLGYLLVQARIAIEGEMKQQNGVLKTSLKKDQIKLAVEGKLTDVTKGTLAVKFDEKSLQPIADAVASGSKDGLVKALFTPIEASIKDSGYHWGKLTLVPELGGELSTTPLIVRLAGELEDYVFVEGCRFKGKFDVKIGFNVGLSAKGWAWVGDKVGRPVLQRFLATGGRALAAVGEWLVSESVLFVGGIAIGTILGTLALTSLCAWVVDDARRKGELTGLATWYVSAYSARVFREPRPSGFIVGDTALRDKLVGLGESDALSDARTALAKAGSQAASGTDSTALEAYRSMLISACGGSYENAKIKLRQALEVKSKNLVGL